jgi:EAL domain-containing protein (putative c-di-GMP-specific phosphodiesterase class I)
MGCDAAQGHLLGGPVDPALLDTRTRAVHNLIDAADHCWVEVAN